MLRIYFFTHLVDYYFELPHILDESSIRQIPPNKPFASRFYQSFAHLIFLSALISLERIAVVNW